MENEKNTPIIMFYCAQGIRPGLGGQHHYCDCTSANKLSTHFVTVLVSVQYLSLLCMKYCAVLSGLKQWKPEYMPLSTTSTTTTTTTTTTTIIESLQRIQEDEFQARTFNLTENQDTFGFEGEFFRVNGKSANWREIG